MPLDRNLLAFLDQEVTRRTSPEPVITVFSELQVQPSQDVLSFYSRYQGPFWSRHTGFELIDPCDGGDDSIPGATGLCRTHHGLPRRFLVISNLVADSLLVLDTHSDEVLTVDFEGGLEVLIAGELPSEGILATYLERYFLGPA